VDRRESDQQATEFFVECELHTRGERSSTSSSLRNNGSSSSSSSSNIIISSSSTASENHDIQNALKVYFRLATETLRLLNGSSSEQIERHAQPALQSSKVTFLHRDLAGVYQASQFMPYRGLDEAET
jgi:hypothetical protein